MNTRITTYIFDCFGVVCDPVLNGWYKNNRLAHGRVDKNLQEVFGRFDLGQLSEEDIVDYFSKYEGVTSSKEEIREEIDSLLKIDTKLVKIIEQLRQKGFKTVLLSNANHSFFERKIYVDYPGFKDLFDKIIISSAVGMAKPDAEIYRYALREASSAPAESLFIDDNKINVDAAIALGLDGFLYTTSESFKDYLANTGVEVDF